MNPRSKQTKSQELASRLELARLQQLRAEGNLENAKERARLAKRRRREAKQAFRRARKEVKCAKIELAKAEELFTETETKLAKATKVQSEKRAEIKRRPKQATQSRPGRLPGKTATRTNRTRLGLVAQGLPVAEIAPAKGLAPESLNREESPSVSQTN